MTPYIHPNAKQSKSKLNPWTRPFSNSTPSSYLSPPTSTNNTSSSHSNNNTPRSRLRPAPIQKDPLESAGLPSKGDTTLLNHAAQESYYTLLTSRYMDWCAATGTPNIAISTTTSPSLLVETTDPDLSASFNDMSLDDSFYTGTRTSASTTTKPTQSTTGSPSPATMSSSSKELATLHMSMRKLREALLATSRADSFAQQVYIFITRASLLSRTFESYHPALLHLLYSLHPRMPLSTSTLHEFVGYQILDAACRLGDYGEVYALRARWRYSDRVVDGVLKALVRDDWVGFWRGCEAMDGYQRALVAWAEDGVRRHVLKCVGRAYLSVERAFVERAVGCQSKSARRVVGGGKGGGVERVVVGAADGEGMGWSEIARLNGVGWEEEGDMLIVKRVKGAVKAKG